MEGSLTEIEDWDIHSHVYELAARAQSSKRLGYVDRSSDMLDISLQKSGIDLHIKQSITGLSTSTGYVCWQTASYMTDWILGDKKCPFKFNSDMTVVELGSGVGGICVSLLGPKVKQYIATDQQSLLKLLKSNFESNVHGSYRYSEQTINKKSGPISTIEFMEFDWEDPEQGLLNFHAFTNDPVDLIIACDTIYNEYLIPHFINAFTSLMSEHTGVLIGVQLRDEALIELFDEQVLERGLHLFCVNEEILTSELNQGFIIYYITK
ncbi:ribosomal lysine N-methyltransferase 5 [[Candida] anglica]|uniref:Ribosomal lysine N-methyltransferase 5 n=1 Tax=[Candida] anglica TaxID=148631 RepID=A0ABP0EH21_9ASCO